MHRHLLYFVSAALCALIAAPITAAELTDVLPENLAGYESSRDPRLTEMRSGAQRATITYVESLRSFRVWVTDVGEKAPETLSGFEAQVQAGEMTQEQWNGFPLFVEKTEMRRDKFIDAYLPVDRLVVWFRLKDSEGGDVTVADLKPALDALGSEPLQTYAAQSDAPRVLWDPFKRVEPKSPIDAETLATLLPEQAGGQPRGELKKEASGYGRRARTLAHAPYGEQAVISIVDRGGLPAGYFPILREGVRKGLFEETSIAGQPVFIRVADGELPVNIEVPGALAVAGERFQVQVEITGDQLQPAVAREVAASLDLQALARLSESAVDQDTFRERFSACEPANFVASPKYNAAYRYEILGPDNGGCRVRGRYTLNPNKSLIGPTMTCTWDNSQSFDAVVENIDACEGPLREQMGL